MFLRIFFPALLVGASIALPGRMGACALKGAGGAAAWGVSVSHYFRRCFMLSLPEGKTA
jgi:hypothetical protein